MCKNKKELWNKQANVCVWLLKSSVLWTGGSPKPSLTKDILHWLPRELLLREQGCSTCLPRRWRSLRNTGIEARKWMNSLSVLFYEERCRSRQETDFLKTLCLLCSLFWATDIFFFFFFCKTRITIGVYCWCLTVFSKQDRIKSTQCDAAAVRNNAGKVISLSSVWKFTFWFSCLQRCFLCLHSWAAQNRPLNTTWADYSKTQAACSTLTGQKRAL